MRAGEAGATEEVAEGHAREHGEGGGGGGHEQGAAGDGEELAVSGSDEAEGFDQAVPDRFHQPPPTGDWTAGVKSERPNSSARKRPMSACVSGSRRKAAKASACSAATPSCLSGLTTWT